MYGRQDDASATGDAFPDVKHGGGTTDGVTPYDAGNGPGVDRSVNPDYGTYYNNTNSEAGQYKGGECTQCHEPHASFGGDEPPPINSSADPYLLMRYGTSVTNYAELCWYCHDNMTLNGNPTGYGYWGFYQGSTVYQAGSHYNPPAGSFYWPPTTGDPVSIWPRRDRSGLPTGNRGSCLNCHTPHGIKEGGTSTAFDTGAVP
ncbi:MAG: cytochrome c3 family protein, partial [Deltaproteobacteria bacterium]